MTAKQNQKHVQRLRSTTAAMIITLCVGVLAASDVNSAAAADMEGEDAGTPAAAATKADQPRDPDDKQAKTNTNSNGKAKDEEIFRPSEEISEDFAVSFPVDI